MTSVTSVEQTFPHLPNDLNRPRINSPQNLNLLVRLDLPDCLHPPAQTDNLKPPILSKTPLNKVTHFLVDH